LDFSLRAKEGTRGRFIPTSILCEDLVEAGSTEKALAVGIEFFGGCCA